MKFLALTTSLIMMFTFYQSASAYSSIFTIDGWNEAQLKEAGIAVTTRKHDQIGEDPPMNWVQIAYDTSKLPKGANVLMTLQVITDEGKIVSAYRDEQKKGESHRMTILFAVQKEYLENSSLQILVLDPEPHPDVVSRENPGFGGYSLSLNQIMKIAGEAATNKPAEGSSTEKAGTVPPAKHPESKSAGGDEPQPETQGHSR